MEAHFRDINKQQMCFVWNSGLMWCINKKKKPRYLDPKRNTYSFTNIRRNIDSNRMRVGWCAARVALQLFDFCGSGPSAHPLFVQDRYMGDVVALAICKVIIKLVIFCLCLLLHGTRRRSRQGRKRFHKLLLSLLFSVSPPLHLCSDCLIFVLYRFAVISQRPWRCCLVVLIKVFVISFFFQSFVRPILPIIVTPVKLCG